MAAIPSSYYGTSWGDLPQIWVYAPQPSAYRTVCREAFDALTKRQKRERYTLRTRAVLGDVARRQGWQAQDEIERRRRFLWVVGKRLTHAQRARRGR